MILTVLIFLVFAVLWYLPIYKAQGAEGKLPAKAYVIALILGVLSVPVSTVMASPYSLPATLIFKWSGISRDLCDCVFLAGIPEELAKFLMGWLVIRKLRPCRKIDAILIFGMSGMGFEVLESLMVMSNVFTAILRGVLALHIITMLWTGGYWWESRKCKTMGDAKGCRRNLIVAFAVPMAVHSVNDLLVVGAMDLVSKEELSLRITAIVLFALALIITFIYVIITFGKSRRIAKESQTDAEKI